ATRILPRSLHRRGEHRLVAREPGRCAAGLLPEIPPGRVRLRARRVHHSGRHRPTSAFAWAGKETYDGAGHVAGVFTASYNGEIVHRTYTGTYTVNPYGTGSTLLTDSNGDVAHFDIFIRERSEEVSYVETDPGLVRAVYA